MNQLHAMMYKIHMEYMSLDSLDIPATLERGRLLAEKEQEKMKNA